MGKHFKKDKHRDQSGQAVIEYIVLLGVVASAFVFFYRMMGDWGVASQWMNQATQGYQWAYQYGFPYQYGHPRAQDAQNGQIDETHMDPINSNRMFINDRR